MTTLSQLKQRIDRLIETQGEESPVAAFIFTKEDVVQYDDEGDEVEIEDDKVIKDILYKVQGSDSIHRLCWAVNDIIDEEVSKTLS